MKFYDRQQELQLLDNNWKNSRDHGYMTVMLGRRRVGKTTLLMRSAADGRPLLYLYVFNDNEKILVKKFQAAAQLLGPQGRKRDRPRSPQRPRQYRRHRRGEAQSQAVQLF